MTELSEKQKDFVIENMADADFTADELRMGFRRSDDFSYAPSTTAIESFISSDDAQEQIDTRRAFRQKRAQVAKNDLVESLVDLKEDLEAWHQELKDTEHGKTRNELVQNIMTAIERIAELQGELEREGTSDNVVKITDIDLTTVVRQLPAAQKRDIVEQLEDDPDIDSFAVRHTRNQKE